MSTVRYLVGNRAFYKSWLPFQKLFPPIRNYNSIDFEDIPDVTSASIKRILKQNDISFEEGYTSFITNCLLCGKATKSPSSSHNFYINKTTGKRSIRGL